MRAAPGAISAHDQAATTSGGGHGLAFTLQRFTASPGMARALPDATDLARTLPCPACGYHVAVPLFTGDAYAPADIVRCVDCSHVFEASEARAADRRRSMRRAACGRAEHVRAVRDEMLGRLPAAPIVIEIGADDGHLLAALAEARPTGRYVGFDADGSAEAPHLAVELRAEPFVAARALTDLSPHLVICRSVLEDVRHPLAVLQSLAFVAAAAGIQPLLYVEVACVDRALEMGRTFDFADARTSYFTTASFMRMLSRCSPVEQRIGHDAHHEVVYGFARLGRGQAQIEHARSAAAFRAATGEAAARLRRQLDGVAASGRAVAIWGGTGAAAAFIAQAGADAGRFPIVVDSNADAVGTLVARTGQTIRSPEWLRDHRVDVVVIATAAQAAEILAEMAARDLRCDRVLIEDRGRLVDHVPRAPAGFDASPLALASR
jgi:hypothetical protein